MSTGDPLSDTEETASLHRHSQSSCLSATHIGRYVVERVMGRGGCGVVFLAVDPRLNRRVAIKVSSEPLLKDSQAVEKFLREAQTLAEVEHPHILPVYDFGATPELGGYLVSKFVEGGTLLQLMRERRLSVTEAASFALATAEALSAAHRKGIIHRDVKPANLLLGTGQHLYLADFGLALREWDHPGENLAGTYSYMSPEQAGGEGHRVDASSDLFSLGISLYQMLTGERPFQGANDRELLSRIQTWDPLPPRSLAPEIPARLEQICLRCLEKRARDRYASAGELADELRSFLEHAPTRLAESADEQPGNAPSRIVPKGLRGFDENDQDFFLSLLPGPRHRDGLPESLWRWKRRVEARETQQAFAVATLYGPSGSGKSSFLRAGLLPRLNPDVVPVYCAAQPAGTERQLSLLVECAVPGVPRDMTLSELLRQLRVNQKILGGRKLLLVIDQFEQWLHTTLDVENSELLRALRQCDGRHLACLVVVRDDFWMATTRLFQELEIPLEEDQTCGGIDLFQERHARTVLTEFGRAYGALPPAPQELTASQRTFVDKAVNELAEGGKVVCIRLAVLAQMLQEQEWSPATLHRFHGLEGLGVGFLQALFDQSSSPPTWRRMKNAARLLLSALLPEAGLDLRGPVRSQGELEQIVESQAPGTDVDQLLATLVNELKLVSLVDPHDEALSTRRSGKEPVARNRFYQLTHDFLVPAIREWVRGNHRRTWRGRTELRLAELGDQWHARPSPQRLPALSELIAFGVLTSPRRWTARQRQFLLAAARHYSLFVAGWLVILLTAVIAVGLYNRALLRQEVDLKTEQLAGLPPTDVAGRIDWLVQRPSSSATAARANLAAQRAQPHRYWLLLWRLGELPTSQLLEGLVAVTPEELEAAIPVLREQPESVVNGLRPFFRDADAGKLARFRAVAASLGEPADIRPSEADRLATWLIQGNVLELASWSRLLAGYSDRLEPALRRLFAAGGNNSSRERTAAATLLVSWYQQDVDYLAKLALDVEPSEAAIVLPALQAQREEAIRKLRGLPAGLTLSWPDDPPAGEPSADLATLFAEAGGALRSTHGWFNRLSIDQLNSVLNKTKAAGYRPLTLRPNTTAGITFISGTFWRDGVQTVVLCDLSILEFQEHNRQLRDEGLVPCDLSLLGDDDHLRVLAVWRQRPFWVTDAAVYLNVPEAEHPQSWQPLSAGEFVPLVNIKRQPPEAAEGLYSSIRWKCRGVALFVDAWEAPWQQIVPRCLPGWTQMDLRISPTTVDEALLAGTWWNNSDFASHSIALLPEPQHQTQAEKLEQTGWRPVTVTVHVQQDGARRVASLWHRPALWDDYEQAAADRAARRAIVLFQLGAADELVTALGQRDDPTRRSLVMHGLSDYRVPATPLVALLENSRDDSVRTGIVLALNLLPAESIDDHARQDLKRWIGAAQRLAEVPPLTSAIALLAKHWDEPELDAVLTAAVKRGSYPAAQQYENKHGQRFIRIERTNEVLLGAPVSDRERDPAIELQHRVRIPRDYYLLDREVTVQQYLEFTPKFVFDTQYSPTLDCPIHKVSWFDAIRYCRWLCEQEGFEPDQMCYPSLEQIDAAMASGAALPLPDDFLRRTGYRLPTEAEWEHACRAGTTTPRPFGTRLALLPHYAWTAENSHFHSHPVATALPDRRGLFDMLGNVMEWCHDPYKDYPHADQDLVEDSGTSDQPVRADDANAIRGGSFLYAPSTARSSQRFRVTAKLRVPYMGFRIARSCPAQ